MKLTILARYIVAAFVVIFFAALIHHNASAQDLIEDTTSWGGWNMRLGGDASGGLTLVLRPPNRSTVFAVDAAGILRFRHWNGSRWTPWTPLAVPPLRLDGSGIDAVATTPERIDLVVRDSNGHVQQIFGNVDETTNRWRDRWVDHGRTSGPPTITKMPENKLQIFALGPNNIVLWKRWDNGWLNDGRWDWIRDKNNNYPRMRTSGEDPPRLTGQFAAVKVRTTELERIDLTARTTDGRVMHTYWNGLYWAGFKDIGAPITDQFTAPIAATSPDKERLEFLAQLPDGSIHWRRWNDSWVDERWVPLTNPDTRPGLSARAFNECRTDVISRDSGNGVVYGYTRCDPENALDVTLTLRALKVHDDCDNLTAGDWFVGLAAGSQSMRMDGDLQQTVFPNTRDAIDIDTGDTLGIGHSILLPDVLRSESVVAGVSAIDCDANGIFTLFLPSPGGVEAGGLSIFTPSSIDCSGEEEITEVSNSNDFLGDAVIELTPGEWQHGGSFAVLAQTPLESGCFSGGAISSPGGRFGPPAYTATFDVKTTRRRRP